MEQGIIVSWNEGRAYGFIDYADNTKSIFVHISNIVGKRELSVGTAVKFEIGEGREGKPQAVKVERSYKES